MTSGIITANIPIDLMASVSETLYAGFSGILIGQYSDSGTGVTVTWQITQAPSFVIGQDDTFQHNFQIWGTIDFAATTQPGNGNGKATAKTIVTLDADLADDYLSISFSFYISGTTFESNDPFLKAVLQANAGNIESAINKVIAACGPLTLGPVGGLKIAADHQFFSTNPPAVSQTLYTLLDDAGTGPSMDSLTSAGKVSIGCDGALAHKLLDAIWWPTATKEWSEGPAEISLDGYGASFSEGGLQLSLSMSGKCEFPFMWGTARWKLDIDTVEITVSLAVDSSDYVSINDISVSKPRITPKPDNAGAWTLGILFGPLVAIMTTIANDIVSGKIRDALKAEVCQRLFKIPSSSQSVSGYTIGLKARGVSFDYNDSWPLIVRVGLDIDIDQTSITPPLISSFVDGQVFHSPSDVPISGLGTPNARIIIRPNDQQQLPQTPTVAPDGTWNYGLYTADAGTSTSINVTQTLGSLTSDPASYTFIQLAAPGFTSPQQENEQYQAGAQVSVAGTALDHAGVTVSVSLDQISLPNSPTPATSGQWNYGSISPDIGQHKLTAYQSVNGADSTEAARSFTVVPSAPQFDSPKDGAHYTAGTPLPVSGTALNQAGSTVSVTMDQIPLPSSPVPVESGQWKFDAITPDAGQHTLAASQTVNGAVSPAATCSFTVAPPAPQFYSPQDGASYTMGMQILVEGTALNGEAAVTVSLDNAPLPNCPIPASWVNGSGEWYWGVIGKDIALPAPGQHTLAVYQTVNGISSPSTPLVFTIANIAPPQLTSPYNNEEFDYVQQSMSVSGRSVPNATIDLSLDDAPFPNSPITADDQGAWGCDYGRVYGVLSAGYHTVSAVQTVNNLVSAPVTVNILVAAEGGGSGGYSAKRT